MYRCRVESAPLILHRHIHIFRFVQLLILGLLLQLQVDFHEFLAVFLIGNLLYYALGIALAFLFRDNRAFCKYICPVTVFLKPMSYFSLFRIKCNQEKCISCGKCKKVCSMNVDVTDPSRKRSNGTECILCMECVRNCPKDAFR